MTGGALLTILFTDLVGSTGMHARLGDEAADALVAEHMTRLRGLVEANGGSFVKSLGDGVMGTFRSARRALACAAAIQQGELDQLQRLEVKVGLAAGEVIERDGDVHGLAVATAARIAAQAIGSEILAADIVRELAGVDPSLRFLDRGLVELRGVPEPVRIVALEWDGWIQRPVDWQPATPAPPSEATDALVRDASDAMHRGAWKEGRAAFEAAIAIEETPEAFDGLATCCRFIGDLDESLVARERAFRLFRERGEIAGATIAAAWLGRDTGLPRGEGNIARAWFAVARRLLEKTDSALARGTVCYYEGQLALLGEVDAPRAGDLGAQARAAGRECGDFDLEMQGLSLEGLALVVQGRVAEGMSLVEEATAAVLGDELSGADVAGWICCHLIYACERVSDTQRASEWCGAMRGFCERWEMPGMFGMCRAHYGSVLVSEGRWNEAEKEFAESARLFAAAAPALGYETMIRVCDLRLRQGRLDDVIAIGELLSASPLSWIALPYLAAVAFERGDLDATQALLDRYLRSSPERDRMARVGALELAVRVYIERRETDQAAAVVDELVALAAEAGTERLRGVANLARGRVLAACGDGGGARIAIESSVDHYVRAGAPFEGACARAELGGVVLEFGDHRDAAVELRAARDALALLGAEREAKKAGLTLARAEPSSTPGRWGLSERELDVLRLAADGLSNNGIADRLDISTHTVHRHMANVRIKLGGDSKAAVVARATREGLI